MSVRFIVTCREKVEAQTGATAQQDTPRLLPLKRGSLSLRFLQQQHKPITGKKSATHVVLQLFSFLLHFTKLACIILHDLVAEAWRRTGFSQELRPEAGQSRTQRSGIGLMYKTVHPQSPPWWRHLKPFCKMCWTVQMHQKRHKAKIR